jgi:hypothetical protein
MESKDKEREPLHELPAEIQEAVKVVDLHAVCSALSRTMSLTPQQQSILENSLSAFLEAVWNNKHLPLDIDPGKQFNEKEKLLLHQEIDEKVFFGIIHALDRLGLNDRDALFEAGNIRLTSFQLHDGKYSQHETNRIIHKKTTMRPHGLFKRKNRWMIDLEADYPDKGRWGDYVPICICFDSEEKADAFLRQLNKAVKVGNFIYFHDIFSRFKLAK